MKTVVQSCRVVAHMLLIVIALSICLVSIMGCVEKSQRPPLQDDLVDNQDKAVEFLESYEWIILQVEATEDFVLPASLIPSIDQEETFYWAIVNECLKADGMDLTPYLGKAIRTIKYSAIHYSHYGVSTVFIMEHEGEIIGAYTRRNGGFASITGMRHGNLQTDLLEWFRERTIASSYIPEVNDDDPLTVATAYLEARVNDDAQTALALTDIIYIYNNLVWFHNDMLIMGTPLRIVYQNNDIKRVLSSAEELTYPSRPEDKRYYEYVVEYAVDSGDGLIRPLVVSLIEDRGAWKVCKVADYL